jgi:dienelactone hydrolase
MPISHRNIAILFFLAAVVCASCSPQSQRDLSQKNKKGGIPQPTPIFYPQTQGPFPAILLLPQAVHEISGENAIARNLAAEGYVARAVDYGDRKFLGIFNDAARMNSFKQLVSESLASLRSQPGVDPNRIGVIGYSLGGFFVTYLASKPDDTGLKAGVIYYGTYEVPDLIKNLRVPILVFQGEDDFPEFVRHAAGMRLIAHDWKKQFEVVFYPHARHGFDRLPRSAYGKSIATDSWVRMIAFMNEHVKGTHP